MTPLLIINQHSTWLIICVFSFIGDGLAVKWYFSRQKVLSSSLINVGRWSPSHLIFHVWCMLLITQFILCAKSCSMSSLPRSAVYPCAHFSCSMCGLTESAVFMFHVWFTCAFSMFHTWKRGLPYAYQRCGLPGLIFMLRYILCTPNVAAAGSIILCF